MRTAFASADLAAWLLAPLQTVLADAVRGLDAEIDPARLVEDDETHTQDFADFEWQASASGPAQTQPAEPPPSRFAATPPKHPGTDRPGYLRSEPAPPLWPAERGGDKPATSPAASRLEATTAAAADRADLSQPGADRLSAPGPSPSDAGQDYRPEPAQPEPPRLPPQTTPEAANNPAPPGQTRAEADRLAPRSSIPLARRISIATVRHAPGMPPPSAPTPEDAPQARLRINLAAARPALATGSQTAEPPPPSRLATETAKPQSRTDPLSPPTLPLVSRQAQTAPAHPLPTPVDGPASGPPAAARRATAPPDLGGAAQPGPQPPRSVTGQALNKPEFGIRKLEADACLLA